MSESIPEYPCPLCGEAMTVTPDNTGVMVKCLNPCDPQCHENAFGHGKDAKDAYKTACEKYRPRDGKLYRPPVKEAPVVVPVVTIAPEPVVPPVVLAMASPVFA